MPSKKHTLGIGLGILLLLVIAHDPAGVLGIPLANAQGVNIVNSIQDNVSVLLSYLISAINFLIWVLFTFLSILLNPSFIFDLSPDGSSALLDMLQEIWTISRDLMNVIFAIGLVAAAVYTVITADKEFISQHAKNFVMAVVLVNFSWFFPRVILDVANVMTATVYGIPSLLGTTCETLDENDQPIPCEAVIDIRFFRDAPTRQALEASGNGWDCFLMFVCLRRGTLDANTIGGPSAVLNGLVVNHARLGQLALVSKPIENSDDIGELVVFLLRQVIILAIHLALFFPLLALTVAFFIRIPILWLTMAFMPFMFLDKIIPGGIPGSEKQPKEIFTAFLTAAFLPAMTAIPLTVGFILINAGAKVNNTQFSGIPIPILDEVNNFWKLLWLCLALAVLYEGVFMVLRSKGVMSTGAEAIGRTGKDIGKLLVQAPLSVPIIPFGESKISPLTAANVFRPSEIARTMQLSNKSFADSIRELGNRGQPTASLRSQTTVAVNQIINNNATQVNNAIDSIRRAGDGAPLERAIEDVQRLLRAANGQLDPTRTNLADILEQIRRDGRLTVNDAVIQRLRTTPAPTGGTTPPTPTPPTPAP